MEVPSAHNYNATKQQSTMANRGNDSGNGGKAVMTTKIRRMRCRGTATETRTNLTQQPTYDDGRNRRRGNRPIRQSLLGVGVPRSCAIPTTRGVGSTRGTRSSDRRARSTRTSMDATINREKMRISISSINILRHLVPPAWAFDQ